MFVYLKVVMTCYYLLFAVFIYFLIRCLLVFCLGFLFCYLCCLFVFTCYFVFTCFSEAYCSFYIYRVPEFYASKYLITNKEFQEFVQDNGYHKKELWTGEGNA